MKKTLLKALLVPVLMVTMTTPVFAGNQGVIRAPMEENYDYEYVGLDCTVDNDFISLASKYYAVEYNFNIYETALSLTCIYNNIEYEWDAETLTYTRIDGQEDIRIEEDISNTLFDITLDNKSNCPIHYLVEYIPVEDCLVETTCTFDNSGDPASANMNSVYPEDELFEYETYGGEYVKIQNVEEKDSAPLASVPRAVINGKIEITGYDSSFKPTESDYMPLGQLRLTITDAVAEE